MGTPPQGPIAVATCTPRECSIFIFPPVFFKYFGWCDLACTLLLAGEEAAPGRQWGCPTGEVAHVLCHCPFPKGWDWVPSQRKTPKLGERRKAGMG